MNFETVIDAILQKEQGYVDHPDDKGGPTNWGITQAVARANGYDGPMQDMPVSLAREIYRKRYIVTPGFDKVAIQSEAIAQELIDTGVNMGPGKAAEFLQTALNAFNQQGSRYADVLVDGRIGNVTLDCLRKYLRYRGADGEKVMVAALNVLQGARYFEIADNNPRQESFMYGWIKSRVLEPA
jgi:lysozyme family protein